VALDAVCIGPDQSSGNFEIDGGEKINVEELHYGDNVIMVRDPNGDDGHTSLIHGGDNVVMDADNVVMDADHVVMDTDLSIDGPEDKLVSSSHASTTTRMILCGEENGTTHSVPATWSTSQIVWHSKDIWGAQ